MATEKKTGYKAKASFIIMAPSKVRPIADLVRSKPYVAAMATLENMPHKGARFLRKVIQSAASNALHQNKKLDEGMLVIKELQVNDGPRMKRLWMRGRGRRDMLLKRMCHIMVTVDEKI